MTKVANHVLIMAGGKSERMRASGDLCHKALRTVDGVSLIERNLCHVLSAGLDQIYVAVSANEPSLHDFVASRGRSLVEAAGGSIQCLVETSPKGTAGIACELASLDSDVVVLNVDNLSSIDLAALVEHHQVEQAAMTIAVHQESFQVPLGEVVVDDGRIIDYREKPLYPVSISSGAYVLASRTCGWISPDVRTDIPDLIPMLKSRLETVAAFEHQSLWIDINDAQTLRRAEQLVRQHREEFFTVETTNAVVSK